MLLDKLIQCTFEVLERYYTIQQERKKIDRQIIQPLLQPKSIIGDESSNFMKSIDLALQANIQIATIYGYNNRLPHLYLMISVLMEIHYFIALEELSQSSSDRERIEKLLTHLFVALIQLYQTKKSICFPLSSIKMIKETGIVFPLTKGACSLTTLLSGYHGLSNFGSLLDKEYLAEDKVGLTKEASESQIKTLVAKLMTEIDKKVEQKHGSKSHTSACSSSSSGEVKRQQQQAEQIKTLQRNLEQSEGEIAKLRAKLEQAQRAIKEKELQLAASNTIKGFFSASTATTSSEKPKSMELN